MIRVINGYSLENCHKQLLQLLVNTCYRNKETGKPEVFPGENHYPTIEAKEFVVHCATPLADKMFIDTIPTVGTQRFLDQYAHDLIHGSHAKHEYSYHERLQKWLNRVPRDGSPGINQINYIMQKLTLSPVTRRAIATTWYPNIDTRREDVPCLQLCMFNIRDGKLNQTVVFRSEDMVLGAGPNMYGLVMQQKLIADHLDLPVGTYTHVVQCPHVYVRDFEILQSLGIEVPAL